MNIRIPVRHHRGEYEVRFCDVNQLWRELPERFAIVTDSGVAPHVDWPDGRRPIVFPQGEASKSLETYGDLVRQLARRRVRRREGLVAFGGGVVGDLAGFAAASYLRGISLIQVPTSLLAMVDSSVGGKVGIDLPEGKNLVGAFWPPEAVYIAPELLESLPETERISGMAEVLKYGLIADAELFKRLQTRDPRRILEPSDIARCVQIKAEVVAEDEFETTGRRAILNFGHTIGHALEVLTGYKELKHGEAIAVGMVKESELGERLGVTPVGTAAQVFEGVRREGLPTDHPAMAETDRLIEAMKSDKKAVGSGVPFSLLTRLGQCKLFPEIPEAEVRAYLAQP